MAETVYIGLGSNLDRPVQQVKLALQRLHALPQTQVIQYSSLYRTAPLGGLDQPDYINAVAQLVTHLSPLELLSNLQLLENLQGRTRQQRWGSRTLDLDILLYGQQHIYHPRLTVPHVGLYERSFVLHPMYECSPDLVLPNGQQLSEILPPLAQSDIQKLAA
ncbi:2-amino-4-hydroxy-6-hydroxymethyldihydropteridine diphosphokinase [Candidatus Albibeggiatoa sp. nov. NOAA]|uniref:2-amino-4-hydroxy-6- hydroxymethyldihydropteridine diphosphokinase n=1 Tax=Candidatus Albibeggiatoa sp. nov. NOAA TaxID=3162724 RepID=UPI0032FFD690|nr:2-amino-4-hydroxy-6-hydroxymethyldihydropteridine diphosphokinase [Thiotrichaceae bacterium]